MNAADALALSMLAVVLTAFGVLGLLLFQMCRHGARRDPHVEQLIEESINDEPPNPNPSRDPQATPPNLLPQPWERQPDWWKKS